MPIRSQKRKPGCCVHCGRTWESKHTPGVRETCPDCDAFLHSCLNCRLYNRHSERCSSVTADCTGQRDHYNYCEEYQMAQIPLSAQNGGSGPKTKWRELFGED